MIAEYKSLQRLGALASRVTLTDKTGADTALRSTRDYKVDISDLLTAFQASSALLKLRIKQDLRLNCQAKATPAAVIDLAKQAGLTVEPLLL